MSRLPTWAWYAIIAVLGLGLIYLYGSSQHRAGKAEGVSQERAAWKLAEQKFLQRAADAKTKADKTAAARAAEYAAEVGEERNQINDAIQNGSSPMDVLFGGNRS